LLIILGKMNISIFLKKMITALLWTAVIVTAFSVYVGTLVPSSMYFAKGETIMIKSLPMISLEKSENGSSREELGRTSKLEYEAKLFGVIPIKTVNISTGTVKKVSVAGTPFGIKMFSDGVMVVGFSEVLTSTGYQSPAKLAGIKMGDIIVSMNEMPTKTSDDVEAIIKKAGQSPITVSYLRDDSQHSATLVPATDSATGDYRTGMWVRDSSAGVGTMTFYDTQRSLFAGLGHGIKDADTQKDIRLLSGEIVPVKIIGLVKSQNGQTGELKGAFLSNFANGKVLMNKSSGVYGQIFSSPIENMMEIASPQEVCTGKAYMMTTISGTKPKLYEITIEKVSLTSQNLNKNMVVKITDPELLALTGGIVQGMSGSP
ncbi:MAG: SpoIVB peptidase S55 domain-containing protein, partial [Oscillospiraceae bacterium]